MSSDTDKSAWRRGGLWLALASLATVALIVIGLATLGGEGGASDGGDDGAGYPDSRLTLEEATAPLEDAPPELAALRSEANRILTGGKRALQDRLAELEGTPVVINKWASWCGPCIVEFPYFQEAAMELGDEVAFLGLNLQDNREQAERFLERLPVPYPSYEDPDGSLSASVKADRGAPNTVFIDAEGEIVHTRYGPYDSTQELLDDIDRYAR
jgi:cytochrome c biogenesis protein CcmG/thiol:disulfide interchange protein DsbE